jgi:hypothetical protein
MMPVLHQEARPEPSAAPAVATEKVDLRFLRGLILFYLLLWVFEGALRKWILPGLANPLLVVRDPFLLLIYALAFSKGVFPKNPLTFWIAALGLVAFLASFGSTDTPLLVELYGLRAGYLHLPLIFVIGAVFDEADIKWIGKWTLVLGLPMALLVLLQFRARDSSWLNVGAGGTGTMIESAFGHIRPSGTFSFTNGLTGFTALIAAFYLYHLLEKRVYPRLLWLATGPVLIVLIILSGSRTAVGTLALIVATVLLISVLQPRYAESAIKLVALAGLCALVLGSFAVFKEGMSVFSYRFGSATNVQNGFVTRFFTSFFQPLDVIKDSKLWGLGLGRGTNAAAGMKTGKREFMLAEGDTARVLLESGPVVGSAYLLLRLAIAVYLGWVCLQSVQRRGRTLPLLLFAGCFNDILQGQFSQPTELGYATIAGGLCLAANRPARIVERVEDDGPEAAAVLPGAALSDRRDRRPAVARQADRQRPPLQADGVQRPTLQRGESQRPALTPELPVDERPRFRGRSALAERLHAPDETGPQA